MPIFEYRGLTKTGKNTKGIVDAENSRAARARLKKDGIFVTDLKDKKKTSAAAKKKSIGGPKSVPVKDLALMTRQLATLVKANIPLVDALGAVAEQVENETLSEAISDIKNMVNEGSSFNKALQKYPHIFSNLYVSMCEAGEMSGSLHVILIRLSEFTEASNELRERVKSAMTYPVIMLVVTTGLLLFLMAYVVPKMVAVFESNPDLTLPWYSSMVIDASNILVEYWYIFAAGAFGTYTVFKLWKKTPNGQRQWDAFSLKAPIFGPVVRMVAISRFTRTLGTLLTGGVPMLQALLIVRNVVENVIIAEAIDDARSNISEGESIAAPLKRSGQFPPIVVHMVTIGEKTGELENMLIQVSDAYDFQVKNSIDSMTSLMGPVVLVVMGFVVGLIVFSIIVPMFEMTNLAA